MDRQKIPRSVRWGAACAACAAAKTRCVRSSPAAPRCDRCWSLDQHCGDRVHEPRKKKQARSGTRSRLGQVPKHQDDLPDASRKVHSSQEPGSPPNRDRPAKGSYNQSVPATGVSLSASAFGTCICAEPVGDDDALPLESNETLLSIYVNHLSVRFPFVIIPPGMTATQLQTTRPLLMKAIKMVASVRHLRRMRAQSRAVMQHISEAILIRSERSLDLLQGILVFLGSYHHHCMAHAQFNNLVHLAVSLIGDMGLATTGSQEGRNQLPLMRAEGPKPRTNEERRALIGVWYMSSNAGLVAEQLVPTTYTTSLDQCLHELEAAAEYETDQLAVQLVRFQHFTENIVRFHSREQAVEEPTGQPAAWVALQKELGRLWSQVPRDLQTNHVLLCQYNSAHLRLFGPFLMRAYLSGTEPGGPDSLSVLDLSILDVFSRFTDRLKRWFDDWLTVPVCSYFYMPQPTSVQLVYACMALSWWARVAGPSVVTVSSVGTASSQKDAVMPRQPVPAFSGLPACPDLSLPQPYGPSSGQMLGTLRADILARPELQFDVFAVLGTMATRFESAKKEMAAAHGGAWENDTWDLAADHINLKSFRVQKWCETISTGTSCGANWPSDGHGRYDVDGRTAVTTSQEQSISDLEWFGSSNYQEYVQWETSLFNDIMAGIESRANCDTDSRGTVARDDAGSTGRVQVTEEWGVTFRPI